MENINHEQVLKDLKERTAFRYIKNRTPADNYRLFQQCISFENGVEFLSSSNDHEGPIMYLLAVPGLSIELDIAERKLKDFNHEVSRHLEEIIKESNDMFGLFSTYYDLYRAVEIQQREYSIGNEKYFGVALAKEYPVKDLKSLRLPILRSNYRGSFLNGLSPIGRQPVTYDDLGTEIKRRLSKLYMLKRRYNSKLFYLLNDMKNLVFGRKKIGSYYRYKGETSDLFEIAFGLIQTQRIEKLNKESVNANDFYRDFCHFLGVHYTKGSNYLSTLHTRYTRQNLFTKQLADHIGTYLKRMK